MDDQARDSGHPTQHLNAPATLVDQPLTATQKRNLKRAIATGLTLAALVIGLLIIGPKPFYGFAIVVILIAQAEFYKAVRNAGHDPATALGLVAGAVLLIGVFTRGEAAAGLVLFLTVAFCYIWYLALEPRKGVLKDIALTVLGVVYIAVPGSLVGLLAARHDGLRVVITTIAAAAIYDIIAYAAGSKLGKHPLAPSISPRKSREGAAAATVGGIVGITPLAAILGPWNVTQALVFAVMVVILAPLGDLFESLIKRDLGIKDMGTIFPGHGGALDRIDAILFVLPAAYLSLKLFGL